MTRGLRLFDRAVVCAFVAFVAAMTEARFGAEAAALFTVASIAAIWAVRKMGGTKGVQ